MRYNNTRGNKMNKIGILGYGEIGRSIEQVYLKASNKNYDVQITDIDYEGDLSNLDVLNICIPYISKEQFINAISPIILERKPGLTVIHSTIAPGTTEILFKTTGEYVVHSPVRGVHPNLYEGIKTFVKFIGSDSVEAANLATSHYTDLGISTITCESSRTTELGKLFSTTYYGLIIAWHGEMKKVCDSFGVSYEETVSLFNQTYNDGYRDLGRNDVIRPTLYPPENGIGGHCIIPNVKILNNQMESLALDLISGYSKVE